MTAKPHRRMAIHRVLGLGLTVALTAVGCGSAVTSETSRPIAVPPSTAASSTSVAPSSPSPSVALAPLGPIPTQSLDPATAAELQVILQAAVDGGAPDAIAAVITADGTWAGAAGTGGPDGRKATAEDEFAIASVTKTFTAALIMRLVEQGKVDLDAPIATYLGDIKVDTNGATVRQALGLRSGLATFGPDESDAIVADTSHAWTAEEILARFTPPNGTPGTYHEDENPSYVLLALAAEYVTGATYAAALRDQVLDPVGATRILEQGVGVPTPKPWALPTEAHRGAFELVDLGAGDAISCISSASFGFGFSSMASDAPSLAAWGWHLFAGDIVNQTSLAAMIPTDDGHGLALHQLTDVGDALAYGIHGGKTGYGSSLVVYPDARTVVVLFVNDEEFIVEPTIRKLFDAAQTR